MGGIGALVLFVSVILCFVTSWGGFLGTFIMGASIVLAGIILMLRTYRNALYEANDFAIGASSPAIRYSLYSTSTGIILGGVQDWWFVIEYKVGGGDIAI